MQKPQNRQKDALVDSADALAFVARVARVTSEKKMERVAFFNVSEKETLSSLSLFHPRFGNTNESVAEKDESRDTRHSAVFFEIPILTKASKFENTQVTTTSSIGSQSRIL